MASHARVTVLSDVRIMPAKLISDIVNVLAIFLGINVQSVLMGNMGYFATKHVPNTVNNICVTERLANALAAVLARI